MNCKIQVTFQGDEQTLEAPYGTNLLQFLLSKGIKVHHSCGGNASCGTCLVKIQGQPAGMDMRESLELEMADDRGFAINERLSCQFTIRSDIKLIVDVG